MTPRPTPQGGRAAVTQAEMGDDSSVNQKQMASCIFNNHLCSQDLTAEYSQVYNVDITSPQHCASSSDQQLTMSTSRVAKYSPTASNWSIYHQRSLGA